MENQDMSVFVGTVIGLFPIETVNLLKNNGFIPQNQNPKNIEDIVFLTLNAIETSTNFRVEYINLILLNKELIQSKLESFYLNSTGSTTSGKTDYVGAGVNLFGTIAGFFKSEKETKAAKDIAKSTLEGKKLEIEAERLRLEGKKTDAELALMLAQQGGGAKDNTALYIGLGIGGLLIVGLLVVMLRKK